jgi:hypothetical protein
MTFIFKQIYRIIKDGIKSLLYDIDGNKRSKFQVYLGFIFVPIVICIITLWKEISLGDIIDTLLTVLSIFTALIFGVLFTVPDKLSQRIERFKNKTDNSTKNYLIRFSNFTRSFVQQITFIIVISIALIILLVFLKVVTDNIIKLTLTTISLILFYDLVMYILVTLSNIYTLLMDDI